MGTSRYQHQAGVKTGDLILESVLRTGVKKTCEGDLNGRKKRMKSATIISGGSHVCKSKQQ